MLLILLLVVPLVSGLACLVLPRRGQWEAANLLGFGMVAGLAAALGLNVAATGTVSALNGFLRADSLSALVIGLTAFVALMCSVYAIGYFRRDLKDARVTERQLRHYYVLTPVFVLA